MAGDVLERDRRGLFERIGSAVRTARATPDPEFHGAPLETLWNNAKAMVPLPSDVGDLADMLRGVAFAGGEEGRAYRSAIPQAVSDALWQHPASVFAAAASPAFPEVAGAINRNIVAPAIYENVPMGAALWARAMAHVPWEHTYVPERMKADLYWAMKAPHTIGTWNADELLRTQGIAPEVTATAKSQFLKHLGYLPDPQRVRHGYSPNWLDLDKIPENPTLWEQADTPFVSVGKAFSYYDPQDVLHLVDLWKSFLNRDEPISAMDLIRAAATRPAGGLAGLQGVWPAPQTLSSKFGGSFPVYWRIEPPAP